MKKFLVFLILSISLNLSAQQNQKQSISFGTGISYTGSGDITYANFELEGAYKLNIFFSSSASYTFGKRNDIGGWYKDFKAQALNVNLFYSPFENTKKNDLKVGGGVSYADFNTSYWQTFSGGIYSDLIEEKSKTLGFNFIFENAYLLSKSVILVGKLQGQSYSNGDIIWSAFIKLGFYI